MNKLIASALAITLFVYGYTLHGAPNRKLATDPTIPYIGMNGVTVSGNVISGAYIPGFGIDITTSNGLSMISGNYSGENGVLIIGSTIFGNYQAGPGITITTENRVSTISAIGSVAIGDILQGGVVVYVDPTKHDGLVLATQDQSNNKMKFSANTNEYPSGSGLGAGAINTATLIARINSDDGANIAAFAASTWFAQDDGQSTSCTTPVTNENICFGGWYLPSLYEWQYVTTNIHVINKALASASNGEALKNGFYWTSTSDFATNKDSTRAYLINPSDASSVATRLITNPDGYVRAMRKFYI